MQQFQGLFGILVIVGIAFLMSSRRKQVAIRPLVASGAILFGLAVVFKTRLANTTILGIAEFGATLSEQASEGIGVVFGRLATEEPVVFATAVLPAIIYFSAMMSALYYLRVIQWLQLRVARLFSLVYGPSLSGSEAIAAAANIFAGQTEAPLSVQPYILRMSRSQLLTVMTVGFATISPPLSFVYSAMLSQGDEITQHSVPIQAG